MFGLTLDREDELQGLKTILERIADNDDGKNLTHKQVRAYARCMLTLVPELQIEFSLRPEFQILMAALSTSGLPHYDRCFIASRLLELLAKSSDLKKQALSSESF
ncbi:hypothetical protein NIES4103_27610 [Nostoc sp. NIES-4103]|nr:hypothetical protein NIES4103_27610 [Nostoc sp. NIES-4103]